MPTLSGPYDSFIIQPVCQIKQNLSVYTSGIWEHFIVQFEEPVPPTPATLVEMVTLSGNTTLAAATPINKMLVQVLQLSDSEFLHLRWFPLDNVEGVLWEKASVARFATAQIQAQVDVRIREYDPFLATTTFWILGANKDMQLEVRNPMRYATSVARFQFFGHRYVIEAHPNLPPLTNHDWPALRAGDTEIVKKYLGQTTWVPAEGRG